MTELFEYILIALACPLVLPMVIDESEETGMSEEISSEEIAALLARESMSKEMTREQAINEIVDMADTLQIIRNSNKGIALQMAIAALKAKPYEDTISRQAALKLFFSDDTEYTGSEICNMIHGLPSVHAEPTRWIPVSERMPKEREWYLAVFKEKDTGFQLIPRVADYIGKGKNKWRIMDDDSFPQEYLDLLECVAWQPLPEPYESQESEEQA